MKRINENDYKYYVVIDGKIESGWEYREDAKEQLDNIDGGKVYTGKYLMGKGLDVNDNGNWIGSSAAESNQKKCNTLKVGDWTYTLYSTEKNEAHNTYMFEAETDSDNYCDDYLTFDVTTDKRNYMIDYSGIDMMTLTDMKACQKLAGIHFTREDIKLIKECS